MRVEVVLSTEELPKLFGVCIELNPLLVHRLRDPTGGDAGRFQPGANLVNSVLTRCKEVVDL